MHQSERRCKKSLSRALKWRKPSLQPQKALFHLQIEYLLISGRFSWRPSVAYLCANPNSRPNRKRSGPALVLYQLWLHRRVYQSLTSCTLSPAPVCVFLKLGRCIFEKPRSKGYLSTCPSRSVLTRSCTYSSSLAPGETKTAKMDFLWSYCLYRTLTKVETKV